MDSIIIRKGTTTTHYNLYECMECGHDFLREESTEPRSRFDMCDDCRARERMNELKKLDARAGFMPTDPEMGL